MIVLVLVMVMAVFVIGGHQAGLRVPFWVRLTLVAVVVGAEACMIPGSVHGFETLLLLNLCYLVGVPFDLWKRGERFFSVHHLDWVILAVASAVMKVIYVHPQA